MLIFYKAKLQRNQDVGCTNNKASIMNIKDGSQQKIFYYILNICKMIFFH